MLAVMISGCAGALKITRNTNFNFDADGNYIGFETLPIPADYTAEQAVKDGCYVTKNLVEAGGSEAWESFIRNSKDGKASFVRIMSIFDEGTYYEDLFYADGYYRIFDSSAADLTDHKYKYILDLRGRMSNAERDSRFVVLTDDNTLTFDDVMLSMISSSTVVIDSISPYKLVAGMGL